MGAVALRHQALPGLTPPPRPARPGHLLPLRGATRAVRCVRSVRCAALPGVSLSELLAGAAAWQHQAYAGMLGVAAGAQLGGLLGLQRRAGETPPEAEQLRKPARAAVGGGALLATTTQAEEGATWSPDAVWREAGQGLALEEGGGGPLGGCLDEARVRRPQASLQAVTAAARCELLALSLRAVRARVGALPDALEGGDAQEWAAAVGGLLEGAAGEVAAQWLGEAEAEQLVARGPGRRLPSGATRAARLRATLATAFEEEEGEEGGGLGAELAEGRAPLHALVLHSLRFAPPGGGPFGAAAAAVVQDVVVAVADAVAGAMLDGVRQCPPPPVSLSGQCLLWPPALHPVLASTRALERFCNEILLQQWWEANFVAVKAMYEDRYRLWGYDGAGRLVRRSLSARRSRDVQQLSGLRQAVSIAIEAIDVSWPILRGIGLRLRSVASWLLVAIVGHSLGLVGRGIQESLRRGGSGREAESDADARRQEEARRQRRQKQSGGGRDADDWAQGSRFAF